ncbi:hypothetical protein FQN50_008669 [Emmonsiellopsis sp. PD_5]|nr:hypothetical protein FQN50_008669 [Emmonsiellopsis sp. PD_5]
MSGQYDFLPRLLYYASLVFAILGRYQRWLVMGALASALSYAGSTAIHAMALITSRRPVVDLDILAAWGVLSTGCLAFAALVHWSRALRESGARLVLILWGVLVATGCIFGHVELMNIHSDAEPACRSASGALLTRPYELVNPLFNCTYKCFGHKSPMRDPSEIIAIPTNHLLGTYANLGLILVAPVLAAAHKTLALNVYPHTPSQECTRLAMIYINSSINTRLSQSLYNSASSSWYGGYIILFQYIRKARSKTHKKNLLVAMVVYSWMILDLLLDLSTPPMFITNIVVNELNLMRTKLPNEEGIASVGQWAPVVAASLVIIASLINKGLKMHGARKLPKDIPPEFAEQHGWSSKKQEDQESGVAEFQHRGSLKMPARLHPRPPPG